MKSPRMARVLSVLQGNESPSTKEIEDMAQVASARDYIRRLRGMGFRIEMSEKWQGGARVCRYKLIG